jgi:hypothetical protein
MTAKRTETPGEKMTAKRSETPGEKMTAKRPEARRGNSHAG